MIDEPMFVVEYIKDEYVDGYKIKKKMFGCPYCGNDLIPKEDRCPKCEQKLEWR